MKKKLAAILLSMLVFVTAGCNATIDPTASKASGGEAAVSSQGDEGATDSQDEGAFPENFDFIMTLGAQTSSTYALGIQISEHLKTVAPSIRTSIKAGASGTNLELVATGQAHIGHTGSELFGLAFAGEEPFTKPLEDFTAVCSVMLNAFHMVVDANAPVDSFADIAQQQYPLKISAGPKGSSIEMMLRNTLAYYGITYEDIESWGGVVEFVDMSDAVTLYKDGQLNAACIASGIPYAHVTDLATSRDIKFISLEEEAIADFAQFGYARNVIPAGTYRGQDEEVVTFGAYVTIVAHKDVNEALIYEITKWMNSEEGISILSDVNSSFADYMEGPETGCAGFGDVPVHAGAEQFYREAGVL